MNFSQKNKQVLRNSVLAAAALVLLAGCKGIATRDERAARQQLNASSAIYRPNGQKPTLPALIADSSFSNYLAFAMLNQPKVESAYYDWWASVERITEARSLPDPQFTFQMDIQNVVTSVMPGLMAAIPWPEKLRTGAQVASAESQSKYYTFQSAVYRSAYEVKRAYYQLHFLEEKIRADQETLGLLGSLQQAARARNETGKGTLQDILRAQIEEDSLKNEIANLTDSRNDLMAQFKAALGLAAKDSQPPVPRFESTSLDLTADQVLDAALAQNAQLKAMAADVRAAEASVMMAKKGRMPDFSLGLMADAKMEPPLYRPLGAITLPIWRDKIAAQIAEAQANKNSAQAKLTDAQIALAAEVAGRAYLYREASRNLALLNDQLLPKARQSLEVARGGYLSGAIDFFNLIDAERTLLGFEVDRVEAATQREVVLAELSLIAQGMSPAGGAMSVATRSMTPKAGGAAGKSAGGGM
jgi:cobalt-zinc-cadmium efflux system outer membrane protein